MPTPVTKPPKKPSFRGAGNAPLSFSRGRRLGQAEAHEFILVDGGYSYRNCEDITNLPPNTLISGSHDVLTNVSGRVGIRKGYTLDGPSSATLGGILSSYDYEMHTGTIRNLRGGFLTSAANDGKLQFRYVSTNPQGTVNVLVVGGGGGGGAAESADNGAGAGGGGGGVISNTAFPVTQQAYSITVGAGGAGGTISLANGTNGGDSIFSSLIAKGGGGGGGATQSGLTGGSGGGAGGNGVTTGGNSTPGQGTAGGNVTSVRGGAGGGGWQTAGGDPAGTVSGAGGSGNASLISGGTVVYGGGGGGGGKGGSNTPGAAGAGGGGAGGTGQANGAANSGDGANGTDNRGGGGGGGGGDSTLGKFYAGGTGGKGVVIIAYKTDGSTGISTTSTGGIITTSGGLQIHTFINSGTFNLVTTSSVVTTTTTYQDLLTGLTSTSFNFTNYWDNTNLQSMCLFVNGGSNIWEWTGGTTTYVSATSNTITAAETFSTKGFYASGSHHVMINGVDYTATGGWGTTTLTGVTPDPTSVTINVGDLIYQLPESTANSALSGSKVPSALANSLIATLNNQVYLGSLVSNNVYVSKVDNYKDYSFSATRLPGEGAILELDGPAVALIPQDDRMYMSAGQDQWFETQFTLSADLTKESFTRNRLKTSALQATQSQGLTTKIANLVVFVSNEPIVQELGFVSNILATPQINDISNSIVNDMNNTSFTNGQVVYHKKFIYVSAPTAGKVFVYNMTNPKNHYWEAPLTLPIGRFSIIGGNLYGHDYNVPQTYKLFNGHNDNGNPISASAQFAYNQFGMRPTKKNFTRFYAEGYISSNTTLTLGLNYNLNGVAGTQTFNILGTDTQIVSNSPAQSPLGKISFGKIPLGSELLQNQPDSLSSKFRVIKTFNQIPFYEYQATFSSNAVDQTWELLACGPSINISSEQNIEIQQ